MSKVAEFINCVIDNTYYNNREKWEVIDGIIIGALLFNVGLIVLVMAN